MMKAESAWQPEELGDSELIATEVEFPEFGVNNSRPEDIVFAIAGDLLKYANSTSPEPGSSSSGLQLASVQAYSASQQQLELTHHSLQVRGLPQTSHADAQPSPAVSSRQQEIFLVYEPRVAATAQQLQHHQQQLLLQLELKPDQQQQQQQLHQPSQSQKRPQQQQQQQQAEQQQQEQQHDEEAEQPAPDRKKRRKGKLLLWQFLLNGLLEGHSNLRWLEDQHANPGVFMFRDPNQAARRWGNYKENENMSYEKMSRCIRDYWIRADNKYFKVMVPDPIKGRRLHFAYNLGHQDVQQFIAREAPTYHQYLMEQGLLGACSGGYSSSRGQSTS